MLNKAALCIVGATMMAASPAFAAVSVTNQDSHKHTIVVRNGTNETQHDIDAGKTVQVDCPNNCGIRDMKFGYSRLAGGNSQLVIDKDGELHFKNGQGDVLMPDGTQ